MSRTTMIMAAVVAAAIGLMAWISVELHAWDKACREAGGHVVTDYVGTHIEYVYNDKGQVIGSHPVSDYRYWCSDNAGQEIEVG